MRSTKLFRGQAIVAALFCAVALAPGAFAQDSIGEPKGDAGKPNPLNNVYFGEQHLHTVNSPDAFAFGTRNGPDEAYRFCKGEAIKKISSGEMIQKKTPYDWCAVTDHAEYMGIMPLLLKKDNPMADTEIGKDIASGDPKKGEAAFQLIINSVANNEPISYMNDPKLMVSIWDDQKKITNKHNDPGKFTTLIAFEWTSIPNDQNLHHNVFFRDDKGPDTQFSSFDSIKREDLWTYQEVQRAMGHENFSIPHNSNVSNGLMFATRTSYGTQITKEWAERSTANTVAVEMGQTKGYSETIPALSPDRRVRRLRDLLQAPARLGWGYQQGRRQLRASGPDHRHRLPGDAGRQPLQVRHRRRRGLARCCLRQRGIQLHRRARQYGQDSGDPPDFDRIGRGRSGAVLLDADHHGGLGAGEHPHGDFRCHQGEGDLRHLGHLHPPALLWRLGLSGRPDRRTRTSWRRPMPAASRWVATCLRIRRRTSPRSPTFAIWALKDPDSANLDRDPDRQGLVRTRLRLREGL